MMERLASKVGTDLIQASSTYALHRVALGPRESAVLAKALVSRHRGTGTFEPFDQPGYWYGGMHPAEDMDMGLNQSDLEEIRPFLSSHGSEKPAQE